MNGIIIAAVVLLFAIAGLIVGAYFHTRKLWREQKNYERSLKMVPLLIHLPPMSDDTEGGSRDVRDVTDETISKAQIVYSIIAGTIQKGFKGRFYGQRHFSFEIVGTKGFVYFYAAVPMSMLDVVQQAVISAYPSARLEEVSEHNIFSPVGKVSGTMGGELSLKDKYAYPIATYQDLKRDALQSILNALSTLEKEDGAGIQILMRPADPSWRKKASAIAAKKKKGGGSKNSGAFLQFSKEVLTAAVKAPEGKDSKSNENKPLSSTEQSLVDAIEDKTRYPGYEVLIRVVASSNISQRSQSIVNNIVASFSLFDAPGRNGFKYTPAKDIESFITAYIMRFFPQENNQSILNAVELATLFHFPDQSNIPTSQLERQASKQVDGPRNITNDGTMLGYNIFRGAKKRINLSEEDRRRHIYAVGQTGTGKSTFLENLALQDMLNGNGFAFIDPHGDVVENLMSMVPKERTEDVIYFNPSDMDSPLGLNMFEFDDPDEQDFLIQETIGMLYKLYDPQRQGIIGPRYEHLFRNAALTVMSGPEGGTFVDIPKLFSDKGYLNEKLKYVTDQAVLDFWLKEMPGSERSNEFGEVKSWFVSKFGAFLSNKMMRNIVGQTRSAFNLRDVMDNKKILLVNLSKGRTGELNSKLLGMIFVMKFQAAAMSRANVPESERVDFSLYVDEFQNFSTDSFASILSEARKYRLSLIVANQFTTQLTEEIRDAVFGNIGTIVSFRVGTNDAEFLAKYFAPVFDIHDLQRIPNFNSISRMLIGGVPTQPFSMATLPPLGKPNQQLAIALKQLAAVKFGRPRAQVEADIFARLKSPEPAKPQWGNDPFKSQAQGPYAPTAPQKPSSGSFLDDWLAKRQAPIGPAPPRQPSHNQFVQSPPAPAPAAVQFNQMPVQPVEPLISTPVVKEPAVEPAEAPQLQPEQTDTAAKSSLPVEPVLKDENLPPIGNLKDEMVEEDTIIIDQEGNMSRTNEDETDDVPVSNKKK
ncbi:MAG: type IV secretion system DNA-binding domain-containing protein [bacterium]|nr:type IV secretion system DNA-binding domain-containing protein [bacterium]